MLLEKKIAVIYGAGGPIGGAVAHAFAREGASVYLAGRTAKKLDKVATGIRNDGGIAETAVLDALDEAAVDRFADGVAERAGRLDISMNVIGYGDVQKPLMEISAADFVRPIETAMRTQFLTTRAAARHMIKEGGGVILHFGGGGPQTLAGLGGFKVALDAIEGLRRQWALELGKHGIRVVTLRTGGIVDAIPAEFSGKEAIIASIVAGTQLGRAAVLDDVGNVSAWVASDKARTLTSTEVNISCGALVDG